MMKKITLVLFALAAFSRPAFGQAVISVDAPQYDGFWSALLGPNGYASSVTSPTTTFAYNRACYLITQAELTRMISTNSVITDFGFDYYRPGSVPVAGQFTLYLENTADITYNKGTTFATIVSSMPPANYSGGLTIPGGTAFAIANSTAAVSVPLSSNFTYTGGGIYVAYDWYTAAPTSTAYARYLATYDGTSMGANAMAPAAGPAPATLTVDVSRPAMRFKAGNTATLEVGVEMLEAPGLISKLAATQTISAMIKNNSLNALTNVPVTLSVTGANAYVNTQTVATIAAGGTAMVNFTTLNSTVNGLNNMTVTVPADQYMYNTGLIWTQTVNCTDYGNNPPLAAAAFSNASYGFGGQAMIVTPYEAINTHSITGIKFAPSQNPGGTYSVCGVLLDAGGSILAQTNTLSLSASSYGTFASLKFTPSFELNANTSYFYGVAQLTAGRLPYGTRDVLATTNLNMYYAVSINGGSGSAQNQMGHVGMEAVLGFSNTTLSASASETIVCKGSASTITLTASGPSTFTWTPINLTGSVIVVTPTVSGASGNVNYNVTGTDSGSGCKSNSAVVSISVSICSALASNSSNGYDIRLFPNPSVNGKSTISGLVGTNAITVFNTLGQVVLTQTVTDESTQIDLSAKPSGNYLVKITNSNNESRTIKVANQN